VKKYIVELNTEHREELSRMITTGKAAARELTHARILLKADQGPQGPGWNDQRIQEALEVSGSTMQRVRKSCFLHGVQEAIERAPRLAQRFEVHYTPKHASWLNMAEIELSALDRQCLSQQLASLAIASQQVAAWTARRNHTSVTILWRFTAEDASIKLDHLYPSIKD
jgi:hypothetical protein